MGLTRTIKPVTRTAILTPPGRRTPVMDIPRDTFKRQIMVSLLCRTYCF